MYGDEAVEYKGYTIEVESDDNPESPREWDNLGTMVCWHRNYNLGDKQPKESPREWLINALEAWDREDISYTSIEPLMQEFQKQNLVIPIMAYEHGGITIRAYDYGNFPDQQWDCGQLGFIYVSHEQIKKEYSVKRITKKVLERATKCLLSEIRVYDDYLTGQVYGYMVKDSEGEVVDSCWGYYGYPDGYNEAINEGKSHVDYLLEQEDKQKWESFAQSQAALA